MVRVTKRGITKELENRILDVLLKKIKKIKKRKEMAGLLDQLLTFDEQIMVKKRLAIDFLLKEGKKYRDIEEIIDVSRRTISFVKKGLKKSPKKEKKICKLTKMDFKEPKIQIRKFPAYKGRGRWSFLHNL
ncbi:hypothetical protein COY31_00700 [Candidatus Wolfebacteria bacterium CG_4_10_14_0_2_um_filter_39_18]|uniref:Uncharacterized protein n=1 Tax=Candidatus Wolfebacteria bacterium CG_4_10_14_0_2_um_filter_39_18 TaxID=1975061 RepID=A0A2M7TGQ8_9BACT|nr:MAG: hypothetical protein COY31_00700 [Candidatus Wolfebacteria bacterium CG_4_10_14_0_2_um_filter_39_18]